MSSEALPLNHHDCTWVDSGDEGKSWRQKNKVHMMPEFEGHNAQHSESEQPLLDSAHSSFKIHMCWKQRKIDRLTIAYPNSLMINFFFVFHSCNQPPQTFDTLQSVASGETTQRLAKLSIFASCFCGFAMSSMSNGVNTL